MHELLGELYRDVLSSTLTNPDSKSSYMPSAEYDAFTVGEAALTTPEQAIGYVRQDRKDKQLQMVFQTEFIDLCERTARSSLQRAR